MLNKDFEISRSFNAPLSTVWKAFTEEEHLKHWWGPSGFEMLVTKLDFKPGGVFLYCMRSTSSEFYDKGEELWGKFVYKEIVAMQKIVFVNSFSNKEGEITRHPHAPTFPAEVHNTLTFSEEDGKTTIHLKGHPINASDSEYEMFYSAFEGMNQGFGGTFDQLEQYLSSAKI